MGESDYEVIFHAEQSRTFSSEPVAVAISLFNYERFILECLDSVLKQTSPIMELIVVDDCSNADRSCEVTRDWMEEHAWRFERASLVRHRKNCGLAEARNTAFRIATSKFVFVMDADNTIYPRAITRLLSALVEADEEGAAYTQLECFDAKQGLGEADIWNVERFKRGNYVDAMALVRKASWETVGGYTHIKGGWEDYDFWCKFIEHGISALFVPEMLCRYRVHGSSMLRTITNKHYGRIIPVMKARHPWLELV